MRHILHVDLDAFFAAIEQRDRPELRGRPVLVGSPERRGVVAAASYEARAFGCRSAQPMTVALRLCRDAAVVRPRGARYAEASRRMFAVLESVTPLVEPLSIDEAFLDVTGSERTHGPPATIAASLRRRIQEEIGITASVGVAPNKFLAKLASEMDKPDGLTVVPAEDVAGFLAPLPVERMWGVGPATSERLHTLGIRTFGDLRAWGLDRLEAAFGASGARLYALSGGEDDRPVVPASEAKSIGRERTFPWDLEDPDEAQQVLRTQVEDVAARLRRAGARARTVTLKLRYGAFETITRSETLDAATDGTREIQAAADRVFGRWARAGYRPLRLIGVSAGNLERGAEQLGLFDGARRRHRALDGTVDRLRDRFGPDAIRRGGA